MSAFGDLDASGEYAKNDGKLKKSDVSAIQVWLEKQPHLPRVGEFQIALFLANCDYSREEAKTKMDAYFTIRTACPEIFANRDPSSPALKRMLDTLTVAPLPRATPAGDHVILSCFADREHADPSDYSFEEHLRYLDMTISSMLRSSGHVRGIHYVADQKGIKFGHLTKMGVSPLRRFMYYGQDVVPVKVAGLHFVNALPLTEKVVALIKPFMKKEVAELFYVHNTFESLHKHVPPECLPKDYGGSLGSLEEIHADNIEALAANAEFFRREERDVVDESKRAEKVKNLDDIFGVEGSFKKLDID